MSDDAPECEWCRREEAANGRSVCPACHAELNGTAADAEEDWRDEE